MTLSATLMDFDAERSAASPETCSSIGHGSQVRVQILEAQVVDLRQQLKFPQGGEAEVLGAELEQKFIEVTKRNEELEKIVAEERDKLVQAAQLALDASTTRVEHEELRLELVRQLHDVRMEMEDGRTIAASLRKQLEEKDQELQEYQINLQQTEAAFKGKQHYEDTWEKIHKNNREKIHTLEMELHAVMKENHALPVIRQELSHADRQAKQSAENAQAAVKERNVALGKLEKMEEKLETLADTNDKLEKKVEAYDSTQLARSAEREEVEFYKIRIGEVERLLAKSRCAGDELRLVLSNMELKCASTNARLDDVSDELRRKKDECQEALAELTSIRQEHMLLDFHEKMQTKELECQAEEVAKLRIENNTLCATRQQLSHAEVQMRDALVDAEKNALLLEAKSSASEAHRIAAESQAAQQAASECREQFEMQLAELEQQNRELRETIESTKGKHQEEFEGIIAELRRELQETKTRHATDLGARTRAEQLLQEQKQQCLTVSRGCSPVRNEIREASVVSQLKDELRDVRARNSELETSKAVAEKNLIKQHAQNANMRKKVAAIATTHEDLRDMYSEHLGLIQARDPCVASYLPATKTHSYLPATKQYRSSR